MRVLTLEQRFILDNEFRKNPAVTFWDDLPDAVMKNLEKLNYTPQLFLAINRYLTDKALNLN